MKMKYQKPSVMVCPMACELPIAGSNEVSGKGIDMNTDTMQPGNGNDAAVKSITYSVWDDDWNN